MDSKLDLLIYNGLVVTVNHQFQIIEKGQIGIRDGIIQWVDNARTPLPEADDYIDAQGGIVMPGLINTHTHLPMTIFRGMADDLDLHVWLTEHMFPMEAKHIDPETVTIGTRLACAELLLSGTTTICDGYFYENYVASAVAESGIRAILGQGVIDFPAPGVPDPSQNLTHAGTFLKTWQNVNPRIQPSIFCHSPYTCGADTLKAAKAITRDGGWLFQIHIAETHKERENFLKDHGMTPVAYLDRLNLLDPNTLLVHAIWVDDADLDIIKASGATISVTTESEMKLASGIAPIPKYLQKEIPVSLGTDGAASNNDLDMFREMDMTAKLHKMARMDPTVLDAQTVVRLATIEGAKAVGLDAVTGSLEPGKMADIIILNTHTPHLTPLFHPASHIVYTVSGSDVRDVLISGNLVVKDRTLLTLPMKEIQSGIRSIEKQITLSHNQ